MLSQADNDLLTQTGSATAMGQYFRRFWQPVALSRELPEPDGPPIKVTVMGEELVAFRNTNGQVGLVDAYCPHRAAHLYFGRNEEWGCAASITAGNLTSMATWSRCQMYWLMRACVIRSGSKRTRPIWRDCLGLPGAVDQPIRKFRSLSLTGTRVKPVCVETSHVCTGSTMEGGWIFPIPAHAGAKRAVQREPGRACRRPPIALDS